MCWKPSILVLSLYLAVFPTGPAQATTIYNPSGSTVPFLYGTADPDTIINEGTVLFDIIGNDSISGGSNTITNSGSVIDYIYGSYNSGAGSYGGSNTITNSATGSVAEIYGSYNIGPNSYGGSNTINNSGNTNTMVGSYNSGTGSNGGSNVIENSNLAISIYGSVNISDGSSGGSNTLTNSGLSGMIIGSYNIGDVSSGGSNTITNTGSVLGYSIGSLNIGDFSSGGSNIITNSGTLNGLLIGSYNIGWHSSGGSNIITNSGTVDGDIAGSANMADFTSGGSNILSNSGTLNGFLVGSYNIGWHSSGGSNTITNSGTVYGDIVGSWNVGAYSTSSGNTIFNSGTVNGDIWGSRNEGPGSSGGNDTITNAGTVNGSIYGMDGNDTIILVGGSFLGGVADGGIGNDILGFNNMGTVDGSLLGTVYLSFENLGIFGGSTTLTGTWDFSRGTVTIYQGNLYVGGSLLTTLLTVERDGLLGGNGGIFGDVVVYGTISPGHSIGTLHVNGSVSFMPGSTYEVELAKNGNCDLLQVNGPVSIDDAELKVFLDRALYVNGRSWRVIDAGSGIHGSFSSIDTNFTSYTINLQQRIQGDSLDLVIVRTPYATFGDTANRAATGSALDALLPSATGSMADLLYAMDFGMNPSQLTATLKGLTPEIYTSFAPAGLKAAGIFGDAATLRRQEIARDLAFPNEAEGQDRLWNVWGRVLGSHLDRDAESGVSGYSVDTTGTMFGMDRAIGSTMYAGLMLGYSDSDLGWDNAGSTGGTKGKHIGVYGGAGYAGFRLDGMVGYTSLENSAGRLISTPAFTDYKTSDFDSNVWGGRIALGYDFRLADLLLGPVASVEYLRLDQEGFSEEDLGDFALRMNKGSLESLTSSLGLRLTGLLKTGEWRFLPHAELSLLHQFHDDAMQLKTNFVDYPNATFTVTGAEPIGNETLASLGLTVEYGPNLSLFLDFLASFADGQDAQLLSGGLSWRF